jgi:hypothetical protein
MIFLASLMFKPNDVEEITAFTLTIKLFRVRLEIKPTEALVLMMNVFVLSILWEVSLQKSVPAW